MKIRFFLKNVALLCSLTFLLWNCQDNVDLNTNNDFFNDVKNKLEIEKLNLPYTKDNLIVDWSNFDVSKYNNTNLYVFKTKFINPITFDSKILKAPHIYVLALKQKNNITIKYLEVRAYDYSLIDVPESFKNIGEFSGVFRYFNDSGNMENTETYIEGYQITSDDREYLSFDRKRLKGDKRKGSLLLRVEPCTQVPSVLYIHETTHHYTDYYNKCDSCTGADGKIYTQGGNTYIYVKSVYNGLTTQTYTYTTYSCDTPHTGDDVYKSEYLRQQQLVDCGPGYSVDVFGNCIADEEEEGPSCESFNFQRVTTNWQESAVRGIRMYVYIISPTDPSKVRYKFGLLYSQPILFGMPFNLQNGGYVSPSIAAEISADVLQVTMSQIAQKYGNKAVSETNVDLAFRDLLKKNYNDYIPGGRIQFNATNYIGTATEYKTSWPGTGNCN
ncbi:hypothetical protein [Tenacibaculum singaporense]|uniref:hypothetical protein n=1 Tax=Tenacibaculum singaporense TaxID=2358479 RepID=UPI000F68DA9F|nr:hypothetical protein [Tenacibaculum singaporense]RSC95897.1 hypothetical protein EI424_01940 [Tenacibaculum singaporense]